VRRKLPANNQMSHLQPVLVGRRQIMLHGDFGFSQRQQDFQGRLTAGTERYNLSVHLNMKV
jgi:hypothetical protein